MGKASRIKWERRATQGFPREWTPIPGLSRQVRRKMIREGDYYLRPALVKEEKENVIVLKNGSRIRGWDGKTIIDIRL